ncbi:MAG: alpha/beta hydrolase fold domain-containing protein [Planctomycetaceae bacterium]|jgi:acetyl esterase/lipase|nr:alpha/beta hydrolase fold domain-containing protein [Planctomycetaceae bacterium]
MRALIGTTLVLLGWVPLGFGQEKTSQTPGEVFGEQFKQLDRDGDGRLSKAEAGDRPFFARADADGDGMVTREEAQAAFVQARRLRQRLGQGVISRPGTAVPVGVVKSADVRYSEAEGGKTELLTLDVYRPKDAKGLSVMVYVHGGGWTRGDKAAVGEKMPFFCKNGYVFVSVNYRMLPETRVPDQAQDVAAAVAWVHDHAKEYGGNPDRIFLMGHSAGAHLVSVVATNETLLGNCGKDLSAIKGLIELDTAALDVVRTVASGQGMHAKVFGANPETLKLISPYEHVTPGKSIPPFMLVVADNNAGKLEQSNAMAKKLREAGVRADVVEAPDKTHGTLNQDLGKAGDKVTEKVMVFLGALMKGGER